MYISISEFVVRKTLALCYTFEHLLSVHRRHQTKLCRIKGLSVNTCRGHSEETVNCGAKSRVQLKKKYLLFNRFDLGWYPVLRELGQKRFLCSNTL